jgi:superfamily II DNA/RNA helicase
VIIATPGRLAQNIIEQKVSMGNIKILVVDEADKTAEMSEFQDLIRKLPR